MNDAFAHDTYLLHTTLPTLYTTLHSTCTRYLRYIVVTYLIVDYNTVQWWSKPMAGNQNLIHLVMGLVMSFIIATDCRFVASFFYFELQASFHWSL